MPYIIWIVCLWASCQQTTKQPPANTALLARIDNAYFLYQEDVSGLVPPGTTDADSIAFIDQYVQEWIVKNLMAEKAKKSLPKELINQAIERKVAAFRSSLLSHYYLETTAQAALDTVVAQSEIVNYYQENQRYFKLDRNLVKGQFIILPKRAVQPRPIKIWMLTDNTTDQAALEAYCKEVAIDYLLDTSCWVDWDQIISTTALANIPDQARLLKPNSFTEIQDKTYKYYLRIKDYKAMHDVAPIDFVNKEIEKLITYKRKQALINQTKEKVWKQATANKDYVIYTKN